MPDLACHYFGHMVILCTGYPGVTYVLCTMSFHPADIPYAGPIAGLGGGRQGHSLSKGTKYSVLSECQHLIKETAGGIT